jgi:hypothetical protein
MHTRARPYSNDLSIFETALVPAPALVAKHHARHEHLVMLVEFFRSALLGHYRLYALPLDLGDELEHVFTLLFENGDLLRRGQRFSVNHNL